MQHVKSSNFVALLSIYDSLEHFILHLEKRLIFYTIQQHRRLLRANLDFANILMSLRRSGTRKYVNHIY